MLLLVLLILLRLLCACTLVRFVAADHATCGGPDEAVMPSEVTGGTADESALDASLGIGRCDPSRKRKRSRSADDGSPPDPNREVNTEATSLFRRGTPRADRAMLPQWPASRPQAAALLLQILRGCCPPALTPQQH